MTKSNYTEIIVILDRSGSMQSIAADMCGGFDQFVADQRKVPGDCTVTLAQFDDQYEVVYAGLPVDQVPPLQLVPRGWTALHDAIGKTLNTAGERLAALSEGERPSKVIVLIVTDGLENRSSEFTQSQIAEMIKHQRETYAWDFVYLGANQDALIVAKGLNIPATSSVTYTPTRDGTLGLMAEVARSVTRGRSGGETVISQAAYESSVADVRAGKVR